MRMTHSPSRRGKQPARQTNTYIILGKEAPPINGGKKPSLNEKTEGLSQNYLLLKNPTVVREYLFKMDPTTDKKAIPTANTLPFFLCSTAERFQSL